MTSRTQWISIDWDHTAFNTPEQQPMDGFRDAIDEFHSRGWKIVIHSANNPEFIRRMCSEHDLRVDAIWGESPVDHGSKPVAAVYIDDRALHFTDWPSAIKQTLEWLNERPVRNPRGLHWIPDER